MTRKQKLYEYYLPKIKCDGADYQKLGWESAHAQCLRFDALIRFVDINKKSILDVGCGTGNLLEFLNKRNDDFTYTGIDILQSMIDSALQKALKGTFLCTDIFDRCPFEAKSFDIVLCSGIFNLNLGNNQTFLEQAIERFLSLSREAFVFNLLSEKSCDKENKYYYFSSEEVKNYIEHKYASKLIVSIIDDYLNNDFTVVCKFIK